MSKRRVLPLLALAVLAALGGVSCRGFFVNPTLSSINVTPSTGSVAVGATQQFTATGVNNDGTTGSLHNLVWSSSDTTVATISTGGLAKGVKIGTTTITATEGTVSGSATLTVGTNANNLLLSPSNPTVSLSTGSEQFSATSNGTDVTSLTTFTSSNQSVAVFTGVTPGLATLQGTGQTTITATYTPSGGTTQTATTILTVQ